MKPAFIRSRGKSRYRKTMKGVPMLPETGGSGQEPYLIAGFLVMAFGAAGVLYRVFR